MPIVYVHGVANRIDRKDYKLGWEALQTYLRRYVAPAIAESPDKVPILDAYWGDLGAKFAWNGISRPRTPLLGQGAEAPPPAGERALILASASQTIRAMPKTAPVASLPTSLLPAGPTPLGTGVAAPSFRLKDLSADELSNLFVAEIENTGGEVNQALAVIASDTIASDPSTKNSLKQCATLDDELALMRKLIEDQYTRELGILGQGSREFFSKVRDRLSETISRVDGTPGLVASRLLAELRKPLNDFVTLFLGDVFTYLRERNNSVSESIPTRVMKRLNEACKQAPNEPLIVLSHSMGGQIVYDLVTHYLPSSEQFKHLRIDFWCATASQVGLFTELRLFCFNPDNVGAEANKRLPFPTREYLGDWWNVWDHTDFISYTCKDIVDEVNDESYNSGMSLITAHGGYLQRPSFFREFGTKLKQAKQKNWHRL